MKQSFGISLDHHRPLTKTGTQTHIYAGNKNPSILPQLGSILYRQRKNKIDPQGIKKSSELIRLVVVYIQTKARGTNKGIVDLASLLPVIKIDNNEVYYDYSANPFVLRLTNRGRWFTKSLLKLYDLSWDQPTNTQAIENKKYNFPSIATFPTERRGVSRLSLPIAASSELAREVLLNPSEITSSFFPLTGILHPPELSPSKNRKTEIISPPMVKFPLRNSDPVKIIKPNLKIQNSLKIDKPIVRSWETSSIKIPERNRSNTISIPSEVPSFSFPISPFDEKVE